MWGRGQRGNSAAGSALGCFQSLPPPPTSKVGPSGDDSQVGGFVYILGPCGSLQRTLLWGWEFLPLPQPPQVFSVRGFEALVFHAGTLGCTVCLPPQLFLPVYPHANVGPPALSATALPGPPVTAVPIPGLQPLPCPKSSLPGCPSPPLLLVWMNVSSLTPWLSDLYTVRFSGSSGYFLFLKLFLSFWLGREAKCIYLCFHLGWKFLYLNFLLYLFHYHVTPYKYHFNFHFFYCELCSTLLYMFINL